MNTITPKIGNITEKKRIQKTSNPALSHQTGKSISFKASPKALMSVADDHVLKVFSQHYGDVGTRLVNKVDKLVNSSKALEKGSRFIVENGKLAVRDKSIPRAVFENVIFPFTTLPLYGASWVLKKAQGIPSISKQARKIYNKPILRTPRKLNELNDKSNQLKGIFEKTRATVGSFIKEKGLKMSTEELMEKLSKADDSPIVREASDYVKENLYKASNKFFDKHTGNFNTAFERPLNRIVTGLVPVAFLANDAYNLSVLCGDKKEDSTKEAKERTKQEISRVFTTAYIQLLTFGAFTKQVNTIPWFTPLTSAATVLFSEASSRKRLGKPIFFLSKERAKAYNREKAEKERLEAATVINQTGQTDVKKPEQIKNIITANPSENKVFASFKANVDNIKSNPAEKKESKPAEKKTEKKEEKKALINANTFKKGVAVLIAGGFAISFLKNSSLTKNSKLMQGFKKIGDFCKKKIYDPLAFKTFEIKTSDFDDVMKILDDVGCKEIANGHRFIKNKYGIVEQGANAASRIVMQKHSISSAGTKKALEQISASLQGLADGDAKKVLDAVKTAIKLEGTSISEMKFEQVARKATEIIKNKKVNLPEEQLSSLTAQIAGAIKENSSSGLIKMDTRLKPFVDIVTEPFKFIFAAANLPFKIVKALINLVTSPVQKKAAQAALGKAELTNVEKAINRAVVEVFGEKKAKSGKISQTIFANAMDQLQRKTAPYSKAKAALDNLVKSGASQAEIQKAEAALESAKKNLQKYVNVAVEKSFDGVTQSSNKNTDLAMMTKIASSTVTSAFLVADNYNMVMIKSDGEDTQGAKETANERIIQRLSALFYQTMFINWFNSTFRSTYNSSLRGMASVAIPNTITTEVLTRKSIGMPIKRKTYEELVENERKNENRDGFLGKYFKFMRLLTGKKPLKDRMPRDKKLSATAEKAIVHSTTARTPQSTNLLEMHLK